jgi:hypothetical protein
MSDATTIATIKSQTLDVIVEITVNPHPSYDIDGQSISWGEYLAQLQNTVEWCNKQAVAEEPFEIHSRGYT